MEILEIILPALSAFLIALIGYWIKASLKDIKDFMKSVAREVQAQNAAFIKLKAELQPVVHNNTKEIASIRDYVAWLKMHVDLDRLNDLDLSIKQNRQNIDEILDYVKWLKDELNAIPQTIKSK